MPCYDTVMIKDFIETEAKKYGYDDIGFVSAEAFDFAWHGLEKDAKRIMPGADTIILLFKKFHPVTEKITGKIAVSSYYLASHTAYRAAKALVDTLQEAKISAVHTTKLPALAAALRYGGHIGENGLYFHPKLGSTVHIQTILTDKYIRSQTEKTKCYGCKKCKTACKSGSIQEHDLSLCIHASLTRGDIPDEAKPYIYQLFGCELCQIACPMNHIKKNAGMQLDIKEVLEGTHTKQLQELTGKNTARYARIMNQALVYAANERYEKAIEPAKKLLQVKECEDAAKWFLKSMGAFDYKMKV